MINNYKIITKISLALMIVGLKFIKPATTPELRSVGSSEPTASNAETAGDVWQTVNIIVLNLGGDELGSYTVRRDDTLGGFIKANGLFGQFALLGKSVTLNELDVRTIGDIINQNQVEGTTQESDVLTLQYTPYPTFSLDLSLVPKADKETYLTYQQATPTYKEQHIKDTEQCLGVPEDSGREMRFVSFSHPGEMRLSVTDGNSTHCVWSKSTSSNVSSNLLPAVYRRISIKVGEGISLSPLEELLKRIKIEAEQVTGRKQQVSPVSDLREPTTENHFGDFFFWYGETCLFRCVHIKNDTENEYVLEYVLTPWYS